VTPTADPVCICAVKLVRIGQAPTIGMVALAPPTVRLAQVR
jgi:hypothetical protein